MSLTQPRSVPVPAESQVGAAYESANLADAYAIDLPPGASRDPETLARFVFSHQPQWIAALMGMRDTMVAGFGLKTARSLKTAGPAGSRIGIFHVYEANATEVIMGEDDKHLNFRASALYQPQSESANGRAQLVLSTVVQCNNTLGRTYLKLITPFHKLVVQAYLRRAAQVGWPSHT